MGRSPESESQPRHTWDEYYDFELNWFIHARNVLNHIPFMRAIRRLRPRALLEIGSGTGSMSIFLSYFLPQVVSLDQNTSILLRCQSANHHLKGRAEFVEGDAFNLERFPDARFDVVFSQGFFEHFSDEEITRLMCQQARVARHVVFSVPNDRYGRQDYGNERLLSKEWWDATIQGAGLHLVESDEYSKLMRRRKVMYLAVATAKTSDTLTD